ncbi:MAG: helix-turn-helix domain-containing protein [Sulfuritalea sp.]|nr:helix-turn-helix domain-containing protein [Sulfuritalea sp.]
MEGKATFARRLREAREAVSISQKQLGVLAGIDQFVASARINQYERGKHVPDLLTAQRLAAELKVPVSYLYEPDDNIAALLRIAGRLPSHKLSKLLKAFSGATAS